MALTALCLAALCTVAAQAMTVGPVREWRFNVLLDGTLIGYHRFELRESGEERELRSEARFNVKVLFINAYRYAHDNDERWRGECLTQINARTDDNGAKRIVQGTLSTTSFVVASAKPATELGSCVQTFAYWNPQILSATRLLNPQTGEYVPVQVSRLGAEMLSIRGTPRATERYRLIGQSTSGESLRIDLWYSPSGEWLALESTTADGRRLRYQLQ
jgi:hypothetical protein